MESGPTTIHAQRLVHDLLILQGHLWGVGCRFLREKEAKIFRVKERDSSGQKAKI